VLTPIRSEVALPIGSPTQRQPSLTVALPRGISTYRQSYPDITQTRGSPNQKELSQDGESRNEDNGEEDKTSEERMVEELYRFSLIKVALIRDSSITSEGSVRILIPQGKVVHSHDIVERMVLLAVSMA
jgi:hypothetical protein